MYCSTYFQIFQYVIQRRIQRFWKRGEALCRTWLAAKEIQSFRWSKKAKITLETIRFWWNISFSILEFSPFSYIMKACGWNLINFSTFKNAYKKREKTLIQQSMRTEKLRKVELGFTIILLIIFFLQYIFLLTLFLFRKLVRGAVFAFWYRDDARKIKRKNWERQTTRNGKL